MICRRCNSNRTGLLKAIPPKIWNTDKLTYYFAVCDCCGFIGQPQGAGAFPLIGKEITPAQAQETARSNFNAGLEISESMKNYLKKGRVEKI